MLQAVAASLGIELQEVQAPPGVLVLGQEVGVDKLRKGLEDLYNLL